MFETMNRSQLLSYQQEIWDKISAGDRSSGITFHYQCVTHWVKMTYTAVPSCPAVNAEMKKFYEAQKANWNF